MYFLQSKAQLIASTQQLNMGSLTLSEANALEIPILNQSKETLTFYSLNSTGQGMRTLPVNIASYEMAYINLASHQALHKIDQRLVFENNEGQTIVHLKGKLKHSSQDPDCYDFSKPTVKVKSNGQSFNSEAQTELLRIYSEGDKKSLYASNPNLVPEAHIVILLDASGSMGGYSKLEDLKDNLIALVEQLRPTDCVSILRYSESADLVLDKTPCEQMTLIKEKIHSIEAGGFTNGMEGIKTSLNYLRDQQRAGYSNNLIMLTDGAFNFGSDQEEIRRYLLGQHISLNYKFSILTVQSQKAHNKQMKTLANSGKGHYFDLNENLDIEFLNQLLIKQLSS